LWGAKHLGVRALAAPAAQNDRSFAIGDAYSSFAQGGLTSAFAIGDAYPSFAQGGPAGSFAIGDAYPPPFISRHSSRAVFEAFGDTAFSFIEATNAGSFPAFASIRRSKPLS
jgi:hypothetical protein